MQPAEANWNPNYQYYRQHLYLVDVPGRGSPGSSYVEDGDVIEYDEDGNAYVTLNWGDDALYWQAPNPLAAQGDWLTIYCGDGDDTVILNYRGDGRHVDNVLIVGGAPIELGIGVWGEGRQGRGDDGDDYAVIGRNCTTDLGTGYDTTVIQDNVNKRNHATVLGFDPDKDSIRFDTEGGECDVFKFKDLQITYLDDDTAQIESFMLVGKNTEPEGDTISKQCVLIELDQRVEIEWSGRNANGEAREWCEDSFENGGWFDLLF